MLHMWELQDHKNKVDQHLEKTFWSPLKGKFVHISKGGRGERNEGLKASSQAFLFLLLG